MIGYGWGDGVIVAERVSLMAAAPLMNAATALSSEHDCRSRTACVRGQRRWREGVTAHLAAIARSNLCWPEMMSMVRDRRDLSNGRCCRCNSRLGREYY